MEWDNEFNAIFTKGESPKKGGVPKRRRSPTGGPYFLKKAKPGQPSPPRFDLTISDDEEEDKTKEGEAEKGDEDVSKLTAELPKVTLEESVIPRGEEELVTEKSPVITRRETVDNTTITFARRSPPESPYKEPPSAVLKKHKKTKKKEISSESESGEGTENEKNTEEEQSEEEMEVEVVSPTKTWHEYYKRNYERDRSKLNSRIGSNDVDAEYYIQAYIDIFYNGSRFGESSTMVWDTTTQLDTIVKPFSIGLREMQNAPLYFYKRCKYAFALDQLLRMMGQTFQVLTLRILEPTQMRQNVKLQEAESYFRAASNHVTSIPGHSNALKLLGKFSSWVLDNYYYNGNSKAIKDLDMKEILTKLLPYYETDLVLRLKEMLDRLDVVSKNNIEQDKSVIIELQRFQIPWDTVSVAAVGNKKVFEITGSQVFSTMSIVDQNKDFDDLKLLNYDLDVVMKWVHLNITKFQFLKEEDKAVRKSITKQQQKSLDRFLGSSVLKLGDMLVANGDQRPIRYKFTENTYYTLNACYVMLCYVEKIVFKYLKEYLRYLEEVKNELLSFLEVYGTPVGVGSPTKSQVATDKFLTKDLLLKTLFDACVLTQGEIGISRITGIRNQRLFATEEASILHIKQNNMKSILVIYEEKGRTFHVKRSLIKEAGLGLFLANGTKSVQNLIRYDGVWLNRKVRDEIYGADGLVPYGFGKTAAGDLVLDAYNANQHGYGRFANDCFNHLAEIGTLPDYKETFEYNVEIIWEDIKVDKNNTKLVGVFKSTVPINKGGEIFVNYGKDYWKTVSKEDVFQNYVAEPSQVDESEYRQILDSSSVDSSAAISHLKELAWEDHISSILVLNFYKSSIPVPGDPFPDLQLIRKRINERIMDGFTTKLLSKYVDKGEVFEHPQPAMRAVMNELLLADCHQMAERITSFNFFTGRELNIVFFDLYTACKALYVHFKNQRHKIKASDVPVRTSKRIKEKTVTFADVKSYLLDMRDKMIIRYMETMIEGTNFIAKEWFEEYLDDYRFFISQFNSLVSNSPGVDMPVLPQLAEFVPVRDPHVVRAREKKGLGEDASARMLQGLNGNAKKNQATFSRKENQGAFWFKARIEPSPEYIRLCNSETKFKRLSHLVEFYASRELGPNFSHTRVKLNRNMKDSELFETLISTGDVPEEDWVIFQDKNDPDKMRLLPEEADARYATIGVRVYATVHPVDDVMGTEFNYLRDDYVADLFIPIQYLIKDTQKQFPVYSKALRFGVKEFRVGTLTVESFKHRLEGCKLVNKYSEEHLKNCKLLSDNYTKRFFQHIKSDELTHYSGEWFIQRKHTPYFPNAPVQNLPSCFYYINLPVGSNQYNCVKAYKHCLLLCCKSYNVEPDDLINTIKGLAGTTLATNERILAIIAAAKIYGEAVAMIPMLADYKSDVLGTENSEIFEEGNEGLQDCEEGGKRSTTIARTILEFDYDEETDPMMYWITGIACRYVNGMLGCSSYRKSAAGESLPGVKGNDTVSLANKSKYMETESDWDIHYREKTHINHILGGALPYKFFAEACHRSGKFENPEVGSPLSTDYRANKSSTFHGFPAEHWIDDYLPSLIYEGTGYTSSIMKNITRYIDSAEVRGKYNQWISKVKNIKLGLINQTEELPFILAYQDDPVLSFPEADIYKKTGDRDRLDYSKFYGRFLRIWTDELVKFCGQTSIDLMFCRRQQLVEPQVYHVSDSWYYSISFWDYIFQDNNVEIVPAAVFTGEEFETLMKVTKQVYPAVFDGVKIVNSTTMWKMVSDRTKEKNGVLSVYYNNSLFNALACENLTAITNHKTKVNEKLKNYMQRNTKDSNVVQGSTIVLAEIQTNVSRVECKFLLK